ncbi:hypothetical protein OE810_04085 [Rhodobacteraceae bacterium XHP0102]|nr:hypothetical protein [Rhodobacteraceae bacterium XHP0102]
MQEWGGMKGDIYDPKALIREAYRIDGISLAECRTIFMDWALSISCDDPKAYIAHLLGQYADEKSDHPMTQTLREGLDQAPRAIRRGGRAARVAQEPLFDD